MPAFNIDQVVDVTAVGALTSAGPQMVLLAQMTVNLPSPLGTADITVGLSTAPMTGIVVPGVGTRDLNMGVDFLWKGASPFPQICQDELIFGMHFASTTSFGGDVVCNLDLVFLQNVLPSVQYFRLSSIAFQFQVTPAATAVGVQGGFEIASGTADCSDAADAQCLQSSLSVALGISVTGIYFTTSFEMMGVWIEPLGLRNFALSATRNPATGAAVPISFSIGIEFPVSGTPIPKVLSWGLTVLWRRTSSRAWPSNLLTKGSDFPPDLTADADFLTLTNHFLMEKPPHAGIARHPS